MWNARRDYSMLGGSAGDFRRDRRRGDRIFDRTRRNQAAWRRAGHFKHLGANVSKLAGGGVPANSGCGFGSVYRHTPPWYRRRSADYARLLESLRKAGLPDEEGQALPTRI